MMRNRFWAERGEQFERHARTALTSLEAAADVVTDWRSDVNDPHGDLDPMLDDLQDAIERVRTFAPWRASE